jgi:hypothetical protein
MTRVLSLNRGPIAVLLTLFLFTTLILISTLSSVALDNTLAFAITADLLITVPVVYFLLIRKTSIPNTTTIPILILGLAIGSFFLPDSSQSYLNLFKTFAMPVIEIAVVSFIIAKVYSIRKRFKNSRNGSTDFFKVLKVACSEILPQKLIPIFATEIAVLYYGLLNWKKRQLNANEFTYHLKSGITTLLSSFIFIILIEAVVVHLLLSRWSEIAAWVLTGLSLYTVIQVLGFVKSLSQRPFLISSHTLTLRYGILSEVDIDLKHIESIELSKKPIKANKAFVKLSPFGELENHNIIIQLNTENTLTGLYGTKKKFRMLALYVDQPKVFKEDLEKVLEAN